MYVTDAVLLMKSKILGRIKILEPEPDMENMSDKAINSNLLPNLACLILVGISAFGKVYYHDEFAVRKSFPGVVIRLFVRHCFYLRSGNLH